MQDRKKTPAHGRFFYVGLPTAMGEEIDRILDAHGGELALFSRNEFVRAAIREKMEKIKEKELTA